MNTMQRLCLGVLIAMMSFSCVSYKKLRYMADLNSDTISKVLIDSSNFYRIKPGDVLYIKVESSTDSKMELFNQSLNTGTNANSTSLLNLLNGNLVDEYGDIELPMVGLVRVSGLTIKQAELEVKDKVSEYLKFVTISLKLMSYRISVLGEVMQPGIKIFERVHVSVFDALASSGDLTNFANRKKVRLIRVENGKNKVYTLDLSSAQMLASEFYYVKPGDVIYVEPLRYKVLSANSTSITLGFSIIALTLSLFAVFKR